jgi:L-arabinose transport system substrate-binding protein
MKKMSFWIIALVLLLAAFPAFAKDIKLVGIYKSGDQQWFIGEGAAAKEKALAMGATEFTYVDVKLDPDLFLQAIDNAITMGVDGILTCTPDQKLSQVAVNKVKEAGIPIIACDDALQNENGEFLAPFVGIDAYAIGKAVGKWTAEYAKANGMTGPDTGMLLLTADTVSSCVPRTVGELEVWKEYFPDWPEDRIFRADYTGPQDEAFNKSAAVFTANPRILKWVIMTINDEGAAGATRALEQAGLDKDAVVIGIGGYLAKLEFKKTGGSAFKATAFINYVDVGAYSAENMMNYLLNGTEIPMDFRTPAVMITADNYAEIMKDQAN